MINDGLTEIVAQLERKKAAIERALDALRGIEGEAEAPARRRGRPPKQLGAPAPKKGGMTPEGRARLAENMKKRWAVKRAAQRATGARRRSSVKSSAVKPSPVKPSAVKRDAVKRDGVKREAVKKTAVPKAA